MNYSELVTAIETYATQSPPSTAFTAALPTIVANGQYRIYREVPFLSQRGVSATATTTAGDRSVSLSALAAITIDSYPMYPVYPMSVESVNLFAQYGAHEWLDQNGNPITDPDGNPIIIYDGTQRVPTVRTSLDFINWTWPQYQTTAAPTDVQAYFAMQDDQTLIICPTPDDTYPVEIIGTWRPTLLSGNQANNWLGDNLPDLLLSACMLEAFLAMRYAGIMSADPATTVTWQQRYDQARESAIAEDARRRGRPGSGP